MKVTPEKIETLKANEVFVFSGNLAGAYLFGTSRIATAWGAVRSIRFGMSGRTYAIPVIDADLKTKLPLSKIKIYVDHFIDEAKAHEKRVYLVTPIGVGLGVYRPSEIAPLFAECLEMDNVSLPRQFLKVLKEINYV